MKCWPIKVVAQATFTAYNHACMVYNLSTFSIDKDVSCLPGLEVIESNEHCVVLLLHPWYLESDVQVGQRNGSFGSPVLFGVLNIQIRCC